ncbi:MAG: hypothetical protein HYR58_03875 [Acidobacteria bacterium]|nr:hypothetical protein [Acidobacteriota bacterium]
MQEVDEIYVDIQLKKLARVNEKGGDPGQEKDDFKRPAAAKASEQSQEKKVKNSSGGKDDEKDDLCS